MTAARQLRPELHQRLFAPRGHRFSRPGANRTLAAPPQQARQEHHSSDLLATPPQQQPPRSQEHHRSGPYFTTPETHAERQARLLRQMEGNPRVEHMLRHGPTPHWFKVADQRQAQAEREAQRLEEAIATLSEDTPTEDTPTEDTPVRGRHRAPRAWWAWPAAAISAALLFINDHTEPLGEALIQAGFPL